MTSLLVALAVLASLLISAESFDSGTHHSRQKRQSIVCPPERKYRYADAWCNNLQKPNYGGVFTTLGRSLPAAYQDEKNFPRVNKVNGAPLPKPRIISRTVHTHKNVPNGRFSAMLMQWGQFIAHDMIATPNTTDSEGDLTDCCNTTVSVTNNPQSDCWSIRTPPSDVITQCMNFVRNQAVKGTGTSKKNPRELYNFASAFIDASMIYGNEKKEHMNLRAWSGGRLRERAGALLPWGDQSKCYRPFPYVYCFLAGDIRVNTVPGLSGLHTVFLREHNRIAGELAKLHPGWSSNQLFQETRRIVAAELQVITYKQWLPLVLGSTYMQQSKLLPSTYKYNSTIDPAITNVFAAAAMRFGHSMVPTRVKLGGKWRFMADVITATKFTIDNVTDVINSLMTGVEQQMDANFVDDMTNHMFETGFDTKDGYDIVSLNIHRGRDHGLPNYNAWREYCGRSKMTGFRGWGIPQSVADKLKTVYKNVNDIDLYSGLAAESLLSGAAVGPTTACLLAEQFYRIKDGDRFFYESTDTVVGFTQAQRDELNKVSLGRILCDNTDLNAVQENVFLKRTTQNPKVPCSQIPTMDLNKWNNEETEIPSTTAWLT